MVDPTSTIDIETTERVDVIDVTDAVAGALPAAPQQGLCHVFVPHTTAGVILNEHEPRLLSDLVEVLDRLVPRDDGYSHDSIDDNADAHLRAMLLGSSVSIPVRDGELKLGTWQSVLFVEGDGPRRRELELTTVGTTG